MLHLIYQITYFSGEFKVKGYLSLPAGYPIQTSELKKHLTQFYDDSSLTVVEIASFLQRNSSTTKFAKLPVFIYCRGGIGKIGKVRTHWIEEFAQYGHMIFAPCYRGSENGQGRDEFGGAEQEDILSAYRFLQSLPFVNEEKISIMGFSRGSIGATQTATQMKDIYKLILWSGVSDLGKTYEKRVDLRKMLKRVIGGTPRKVPSAYKKRSPIELADQINCPVLIMHGTNDDNVNFSHGLNMYQRLKQLGHTAELHAYEGCQHHFPKDIHTLAIKQMFKWIHNGA